MKYEIQNTPQLRFPGFEGEWENKKLSDVTSYVDYRGRAPIKTDNGHFLVTAKNIKKGFIDYECSKEYVAENDYCNVMSKGLPEIGDIVFTTEAPMGNVALVDRANIALAQRVIKFRGKEMLSNFYLLHYMLSNIFQSDISKKAIGTTVQGISGKELHRIKISLPTLPEQQKIASFLSAVDEKIQQLSRKKELLEQYKKGVMQQLFSGKLRFKDENSEDYADWERGRFSKYIKLYRGSSPRPIIKYVTTSEDGVNWIKIGDTKQSKNYRISSVSEKITKKGSLKSRFVERGEIILANSMSFGKSYLLQIEGCIYDGWFVLREYEKSYNREFLLQVLNSEFLQRQYFRLSTGGVVQNISSEIVYSTLLFRPVIEEQQKIATFLSNIDAKIESASQQINQTQSFKKGLLQQMFV